MDFLSTWSFSRTGTLSDWKITRDVSKVLTTKLMYVGRNSNLIRNPIYHRMAIYESLVSMGGSRLIETCQLLMAMNCKQPKDLSGYDIVRRDLDIIKYRDRVSCDYEYENEINSRCNFDLGDLYSVAVTNTIYRGNGSSELDNGFPIKDWVNNI